MNYKEFQKSVLEEVKRRTGEDVRLCETTKNNSVVRVGIIMGEKEILPIIYLEDFFYKYQQKICSIETIAKEIIKVYNEHRDVPFSGKKILEKVGREENVICKLIHTDSNVQLLQRVPHKTFLDLSVIYYLDGGELKDKSERMTILITNDILKMIPLREEKLYELALKNMEIKFEYKFYNMIEIFEEMPIDEEEKRRLIKSCEEEIMYVLTNKEKFWGATAILRIEILEEIGKKLKQNFYIIPSSIDEVLIVPSYADIDREMMDIMIQEVNETQVSKEERLSDHAYYYSIEERKIFL